MAPIFVPVTVGSIAGAEDTIDAMDLRAFGVGRRTWHRELRFDPVDWLVDRLPSWRSPSTALRLGLTGNSASLPAPVPHRLRGAATCGRRWIIARNLDEFVEKGAWRTAARP